MKAKNVWGVMAAALLATGSMAAYAQQCGPQGEGDRPHGGPGGGSMAMSEGPHGGPMGHPPMGLDLERAKQAGATEAQIQTLADFQLEQQTQRIDLQASADKADLKLGALLKAKATDEKAIMQVVDTINQARSELFKLEIASMLKAKQVLGEAVMQKLHSMTPPPPMGPGMHGSHGDDKTPAPRDEDRGPVPEVK